MSIKTYEERLVGLRPLQTYVPEHLLRAEIAELRAALEAMNDDLRDHFAGLAMQGLVAQSIGAAITSGDFPLGANWSYQMADAMMEARKK